MKKACIITLCGNVNYGNKLQNYALQKVVSSFGFKTYTIWNKEYKFLSNNNRIWIIKSVKNVINHILRRNYLFNRYYMFKKFNLKYLNYYYKSIYYGNAKRLKGKFNKVIIGSDQIWKWFTRGDNFGNLEFGLFEASEKVYSYAASFGISEIPENKRLLYSNGLNHINKMSVREQNAIKMVENLSGRKDAILVLDPTLLLSKEEWQLISKKPRFLKSNDKYILLYFLGECSILNSARLLALECGYKLICINTGTYEYFHSGPCEFVYLFENAEMVITDSFHACTFSIIFNKPFYVFERKSDSQSMISRIDSLLNRYGLVDRKINNINQICFDNFRISNEIYIKINEDIDNSISFLKKCLNEE